MSLSGKYIIGGAAAGALARFLIAGEFTLLAAARNLGYGITAFGGATALTLFWAPAAEATGLALSGLAMTGLFIVARAIDVVMTARVKADIAGVHLEDKGE